MRLKPHLFVMGLSFLLAGAVPAAAQMGASDVVMRLDALENQIRQLTGQVEQLQYRNQQLEQQLRSGDAGGAARAQPQRQPAQTQPPVPQGAPQTIPGRRSDVDPGIDQRNDPRMNDPRAADPRFSQTQTLPRLERRVRLVRCRPASRRCRHAMTRTTMTTMPPSALGVAANPASRSICRLWPTTR
jgi:hypothetical protein